jgi:hypothetical protein
VEGPRQRAHEGVAVDDAHGALLFHHRDIGQRFILRKQLQYVVVVVRRAHGGRRLQQMASHRGGCAGWGVLSSGMVYLGKK